MHADGMPQRIHCRRYGSILYEGIELKRPDEIVQRYEYRCPKCGRKLSSVLIKIAVEMIT
jgi:hypothetical protein